MILMDHANKKNFGELVLSSWKLFMYHLMKYSWQVTIQQIIMVTLGRSRLQHLRMEGSCEHDRE